MNISSLKIGELIAKIPIMQGGMGVGVSGSRLASAVALEGGIGVISGIQIGYKEPDFENNWREANIRALRKEIRKAKELAPKGIIGANFLVAMNNYYDSCKTAVEEGIDLIISGAGLPTGLPDIVKGSKTKIAPIVSSARAISVICKLWDKKFSVAPDLVVVEGPNAGGHLGFHFEELENGTAERLEDIVPEVIQALKPYEKKYNRTIPVVAAGGIYTGSDMARFLKLGASGVQIATRFVATEECDANIKFKEAYINAKEEDIKLVHSPVGMPGRAVRNHFTDYVEANGKTSIKKCYNCLKTCNPKDTPYCISRALIQAVNGNLDEGLIFTGSNSYKINKIVKVKELINEILEEAEREI